MRLVERHQVQPTLLEDGVELFGRETQLSRRLDNMLLRQPADCPLEGLEQLPVFDGEMRQRHVAVHHRSY